MDIDASSRWLVFVGCICAGLGVAAGAFGAHLLKGMLDQPLLAVYDTATRYQMYHAFGMVLSGVCGAYWPRCRSGQSRVEEESPKLGASSGRINNFHDSRQHER